MPAAVSRKAPERGGGAEGPGVDLRPLMRVPEAVTRAAALVRGLDACLLVGFGRLGAEQSAALAAWGRALGGTPLGAALGRSLAALGANEFVPRHVAVLAAARAAVQGAQYAALRAQAAECLGRSADGPDSSGAERPGDGTAMSDGTARGSGGAVAVLCDSARQWLMELAITGFKQLDAATLAPFSATLENLQSNPNTGRLACLLTGFQQEMLAALPIGKGSAVPVYRWADLWTRAMVGSLAAERGQDAGATPVGKVSGTLTVLGVDLRQHATFVSAVVYGILQQGGGGGGGAEAGRVVRVTLNSYKVGDLRGREVWRCFAADQGVLPLLRAVSTHVPLKLKDMTLLASGDLLWDGSATEAGGKPADVFRVAAEWLGPGSAARWPGVMPADRHPVQLGEPVLMQGVRVEAREDDGGRGEDHVVVVEDDELALPLMTARLPPGGELTREDALAADTVLGLLRFDAGGWRVQPLAVRPGAAREKRALGAAFVGSDALEVATKKPKKGEPNTLAVLQERAGRLLRKKS